MTILHTSDWHLGKRLVERERLPEQIEVLDELAALCESRGVELVLVAGDVFDTRLPSAEAEEVFFRAVKKLAGKDRAVVIIAGNHDDALRLAASAPLAAEEGIYLFGNRTFPKTVETDRATRAVETGENYAVIENGRGERVYLNALSYPGEARFKEEKSEETYEGKVRRWISVGDAAYDGTLPRILLSHLFVAGGLGGESERDISLGGARAVPLSVFEGFDYVALGHLHKPQVFSGNVAYSGSLLPYAFDEAGAEKGAFLLTTEGKAVSREFIPFTKGLRLSRLECNGVEDALSLLRMHENELIELTLNLDAPLSSAETHALTEANRGLTSLRTNVKTGEVTPVVRRSELDAGALFEEYYRVKFGGKPSEEMKTAFLGLLEDV